MDYTDYSSTPASNNLTPPDGAPEGMAPSGVNDTMRSMMAQVRLLGDLGDVLWGTVSGSGTPSWVRGNQAGATPWLNSLYENTPGDISTLLAGIYSHNTSSDMGISGRFTAANDPTDANADSPRNLLTILATNSGSTSFVNGLLAIAQATAANTGVGHNLISAGGGTPGAKKIIGLEIDQQFGAGDSDLGGSNGLILNTFNVDQAGAAILMGAADGTWSNGIGLSGLHPTLSAGMYVPGSAPVGCSSASVVSGGGGYVLNELVTVSGGTLAFSKRTIVKVTGVSGGVITSVSIQQVGQYTVAPGSPAAQLSTSGAGVGGTFQLGYSQLDAMLNSIGAVLASAAIRIGNYDGLNNQIIRFEDAALDGNAAAIMFSDPSNNFVINNRFANTFFESNGTPVMQLTTAAVPNTATPLFLLVGNNAGPNFVAVTLGVADSGGAGFKVLRVPN